MTLSNKQRPDTTGDYFGREKKKNHSNFLSRFDKRTLACRASCAPDRKNIGMFFLPLPVEKKTATYSLWHSQRKADELFSSYILPAENRRKFLVRTRHSSSSTSLGTSVLSNSKSQLSKITNGRCFDIGFLSMWKRSLKSRFATEFYFDLQGGKTMFVLCCSALTLFSFTAQSSSNDENLFRKDIWSMSDDAEHRRAGHRIETRDVFDPIRIFRKTKTTNNVIK